MLRSSSTSTTTIGCPINITMQGGSKDCFHSNVTDVALNQCSQGSSSNCQIAFSYPSSSSSVGCDEQSFPGNYYVAITYRCQPEFSRYLNGSAWAISMCENDIRNVSLLNINSDVSGLLGNYIYNSSCTMSLLLPRYTDATIRANFFYKKPHPTSPCDQRIEIQEVLAEDSSSENVIIVCASEDPAVSVACSTEDRYFRVKYVTNNNSVGVIFVLQVQANYESLMRIQGGSPPSAEVVDRQETTTTTTDTSSTSAGSPSITGSGGHESTTLNPLAPMIFSSGQSVTRVQLIGIIVGCVIAAVIIVLVIVIAVCARSRRKIAKLSDSRLDQNSGTAVDESARTMKTSTKKNKENVTEVYGVKGGPNNFSYVTECYVDGNQTSRLVVPTKQTIKTVFDV